MRVRREREGRATFFRHKIQYFPLDGSKKTEKKHRATPVTASSEGQGEAGKYKHQLRPVWGGVGRLEKIKRMSGTVSFLSGGKVKSHEVMWKPRNECRDRSVRASAALPPPNTAPPPPACPLRGICGRVTRFKMDQ